MQFQKTQLAVALSALLVSASVSGAAAAATGYEVTELEPVNGALSFTVTSMNNSGNYTGVGYNLADIKIRTNFLDPEAFENIDDLNNLSALEYLWVRNYLLSTNGSLASSLAQKISSLRGFLFDGVNTPLNDALDQIEPATGLLSQSNDVLLNDLNEQGYMVGEHRAPFIQQEGVNADNEPVQYFVRDRYPHGLWSDGVNHVELPAEPGLTYGGLSRAYAINDMNQVVGYAAVADNSRVLAAYEKCTDPEADTAYQPVEVCMHTAWFSERFAQVVTAPLYTEQAYLWTLDETGSIVNQRSLGTAPTLLDEQDDVDEENQLTGVVRSEALDINNQGVAVGFTSLLNEFFTLHYASVFKDGEAVWALPEKTEGLTQSRATHINDNGYILGYALRRSFQFTRKRLFIAHVDGREPVFPAGYFSHSGWEARDMNNQNLVVGRAERDRTHVQNRPTSAFLYDIETDTLTDLNAKLACNSEYYLYDAVSINDNGEIIALANKEITREIDGRTFTVNSVQPLLLKASDTVEACGDNTGDQTRKGAALSPIQFAIAATLSLFGLLARRRVKLKK